MSKHETHFGLARAAQQVGFLQVFCRNHLHLLGAKVAA